MRRDNRNSPGNKTYTHEKKFRDADKSEEGWTRADGTPMRKRSGKKTFQNNDADERKNKNYPSRKDFKSEFSERKKFSSDNNKSRAEAEPRKKKYDREPGNSFGEDRLIKVRQPGKLYKENRSFSKNKKARDFAYKYDRSTDNIFREDRSIKEKQPGKFYKENQSFSKNKKAGASPYKKDFEKRPVPYRKDFNPRGEKSNDAQEGIRLNRFISNAGICSRREADDLIVAGLVSVNGKIVTELGTRVHANDDVRYNGERMKRERMVYLILNKPKDYITTTDDPHAKKTVMELVNKACRERIYPVGRLDRNTTGLLMFTNDGEMTKSLTHPSSRIHKVYHAELDKPLRKEDMNAIAEGVELEDGLIKVDDIAYDAGSGGDKRMIGVELHSGKNRIVRRLFEHFDYEVRKLDRVIFAGLTKKDLPRGRWRFLTEEEINMLKMITGGRKNKKIAASSNE